MNDEWRIKDPAIPEQVQSEYLFLFNEVLTLTYHWQTFNTLFGHSKRRIELMNVTAPKFFLLVQRNLIDQLVLILSRLLDPATSGRQKTPFHNATFAHFVDTYAAYDQTLASTLTLSLEELKTKFADFRFWRDKAISHSDFNVAHNVTPLPKIHFDELGECIELSQKWIESPQTKAAPNETVHWTVMEIGGADAVIAVLKNSVALMNWERSDWRNRGQVPRNEASFDDA